MTAEAAGAQLRLLLVEDDEVDRMAVRRALRDGEPPVEIVDAGSVAEAVALLAEQPFDCAVVDYNLPDGAGLAVLAAAAAAAEPVPTIMLTGQGDEGLAVDLMKEGARDYIPKSALSPARLVRSIRHVVAVSRAEREARRARRSQEFLVDVSAQLAQSLDFLGTAERLTRAAVPELAEIAVLHLIEDDGAVRMAACARVPPDAAELPRDVVAPQIGSPLHAAITSGAPALLPDAPDDWLGVDARSLAVVPLTARGRTLGALTLARASLRRFDQHDLNVALNLASRAGLALDNARLFRELGDEMRLVETLHAFGNRVTSELNLEAVVAIATDEATAQVGAELGVFCYREADDPEDAAPRMAASGAPQELAPVLAALAPERDLVRVADLARDARGERIAERTGAGAAPMRSYLAAPVDLPDGEPLGTLCFVHGRGGFFQERHERVVQGIARWAAVAVQNARLLRQAQQAAEARDAMLAVVSHDLRNPLNVIATSASLILEIPLPEEKKRSQLEVIRRTTERMNRLIQDLLDVTGIEAGRLSIHPEPLDVDQTLEEACEMMAPLAVERRLELARRPLERVQMVRADRERLLQVFSNLVGNAIRFTPEGGSVTVGAEAEDGAIAFVVEDTGAGIPTEDLPRLFDRFWKGKQSSGSGLGLPIAKGIVEVHGGTIGVDSEPGRGTRVRFTIPVSGPAASAATVPGAALQRRTAAGLRSARLSQGAEEVG